MIDAIFSPQLIHALGWTLLHSLWQGALFAILLGVLLIVLRRYSAQARYLVAVGLFGCFFLTTGLTFVKLYNTKPTPGFMTDRLNGTALPAPAPPEEVAATPGVEATGKASTGNARPASIGLRQRMITYFDTHLPLIVTLWLMGVLILLLRLLGQLAYMQRLKSYGATLFPEIWRDRIRELEARLGLYRPVRYVLSYRVSSPMIFGWLRPVLLFPKPLFEKLTTSQIYAILAHEMAHIHRNDFLVNLLQQFLSTVFFFHPGVWWMSERIGEEREHSCDDLAVQITREPIGFAKTLIKITEEEMKHPTLTMAIQGRENSGFRARIIRLLSHRFHTATFGEGVVTALLLVLCLGLAILATGQAPDQSLKKKNLPAAEQLTAEQHTEEHRQMPPPVEPEKAEEPAPIGDRLEHAPSATTTPSPDDLELFLDAIEDGNRELVEYFLEKGVDVNGVSTKGCKCTPLMAAADENQAEIARLLIDRGANVNFVNKNGWTALMEAADEGSYETARILLQAGADVNLHGETTRSTALNQAASEGHLSVLKLLLDAGADPQGDGKGQPPLHEAAEEGKLEVVRFLLDAGVAVDQKDDRGRTALSHAAEEDQPEVVRLLLERGANPGIKDHNGHSALDEAAEEDSANSFDQLMGTSEGKAYVKANPDVLVRASREGALSVVRRLVQAGTDVNGTNENGETPLMGAAREDEFSTAEFLIQNGANVNAATPERGWTPLLLAAREGADQLIRLLLEKGADLNARAAFQEININGDHSPSILTNYSDATALLIAVEENEPESVELLLAAGADVNATSKKARWVLPDGTDWHSAQKISAGNTNNLQPIYQTENWTPLMEAVEMQSVQLVKMLLAAGADARITAGNGRTALSLAKELDNKEIVRMLEK